MESELVWLTPLLMLPGIATLIISTASRYATLHDEIHRWLDNSHERTLIAQAHLVSRAVHFRNALVAQYVSIFIMICASLIGFVLDMLDVAGDGVVLVVLTAGVAAVGYGAFELIRESRFSLAAIKSHVSRLVDDEA